MFVERLTKEQIITLADRMGLFGENAAAAYEHYFFKNAKFVTALDEKRVAKLKQKLSLNPKATIKSLVHTLTINDLCSVSRSHSGSLWFDVRQFSPKGIIWTLRNIGKRDIDLEQPNCYLFEDFGIFLNQPSITVKDFKNMNAIYRAFMTEIFGDEYIEARRAYNSEKLARRGFGAVPPTERNWIEDLLPKEGHIIKPLKWQIAKKAEELSKAEIIKEN